MLIPARQIALNSKVRMHGRVWCCAEHYPNHVKLCDGNRTVYVSHYELVEPVEDKPSFEEAIKEALNEAKAS